jgi:hypothetical protein
MQKRWGIPIVIDSTNAFMLEFVICMLSTNYCKSQEESTRNKKAIRGTRGCMSKEAEVIRGTRANK